MPTYLTTPFYKYDTMPRSPYISALDSSSNDSLTYFKEIIIYFNSF